LKDKSIIKTITDTNVNRIRMTLGVERLLKQENNGDTNPTSVTMTIEILKDNNVVSSRDYTFNGKHSNPYREMFDITTVPKAPFSIRVSRVEPDSLTNKVQNTCFWSSYTEIIDKEFAYPNTALVGIKIDSEYFSNVPTRNYEIKGLIVKVPSNYNPETHTYTSDFWDGSFKLAWTNNPAWVFYDLVTNTRYGMGKRLQDFNIDKWQLYAIGRYCDELVPDGFGGTEPRMTCNIWITDQRKAYDLVNDICSIFRAMPVWNGQALTAIQDRKADPVWTYTNANTIGGFTRQRSARKARHNTIQVQYIDASDFYEKKIESVSDDLLVARYGLNVKKITAFGCTSRGQAYRTGRWILETEKLETETITFTVGQEGVMHLPYDVIEVADSQFAGVNVGGRILAVNNTKVTLDRSIEIDDNSYLSYVSAKGTTENVKIVSFDKQNNIATVAKNLNGTPELTVWALSTKRITTGLYRAISIKENDNADGKTYTITALQHVPEKEEIVINGTHFDPKPQTVYGDVTGADINYNGSRLTLNGTVNGSFNVLSSNSITNYTVKLLKSGSLVYIEKGLPTPDITVDDLENGDYTAQILAYNDKNQLLNQYTKTFTINKPPIVTGIEIKSHLSSVVLTWDFVDNDTQTEIWCSETDNIDTAQLVERITGVHYTHAVGAKQIRYYWLRNKRGINVGKFDQVQGRKGESGVDIDTELEVLNKELSKNIVNEIIDVALPARKLGLTKYVSNLNVNVYQGQKQVYDETTNKTYNWNGTKYVPVEIDLSASKIKGLIQPNQLAPIPTTKLDGKLTDTQIQSLSATKLVGNINIAQIPSIPTNKLTGLLSDSQLQNISATKITGTLDISKVPNIPTSKLTGTVGANQISANSIGTNHLGANAVTAQKILSGAITSEKITSNAITADKIASNAITTDKLSANAITAQKIAANAIESNHIKAGAIVAGKLASNSVVANNIATNAITATKIMAGAITAEKLSANSVGANAIQAGAIGTDKLSANAVDSGKIRAGAVTADHLRAGQISADKLAIGLGGNLFYNPIFANNGNGWTMYVDTNNIENNRWGFNRNAGRWDGHSYLDTENQFRWERTRKNTNNGNVRLGGLYQDIKLVKDKYYCFSAYVGGHRAYQDLDIENGAVEVIHKSWSGRGRQGGFEQVVTGTEEEYRIFMIFKAKANNDTSYRFIIRQWANGRQNNPFVFIRRPMLEECTEYSRQPSGWVNAGVTSIHGGSIITNSITAEKIGANQITANHIAGDTITARHIAANSITGDKIVSRSITADKIVVQKISVISSDLGSITAGSLKIGSLNGNYGTMFEIQQTGGFRLISRDATGGIELSSATRALHVWNGANEVVRVGKLS
ncbi:TPA: host specificity protein J, partial [Haemophilus influenzae]